jgi:hypothetical protein
VASPSGQGDGTLARGPILLARAPIRLARGRLRGERGGYPVLDLVRHDRCGHRRQHRADRVELLAHRRALGAAGHVRREPPATEAAN